MKEHNLLTLHALNTYLLINQKLFSK